MRGYNVDFGLGFIACIFIMIFNEIWRILDTLPEIFPYGNFVYHSIAGITSIITQLAIGLAAAIIFYYCIEFLDKKKNYEFYTGIRTNILFMFYSHLELLTKIESFQEINMRERHVAKFYDYYDIPLLVRLFEENSTDEKVQKIKNEFKEFFTIQSDKQIETFTGSFKRSIEELKNKVSYRYFKESKELIESIYTYYDDDFAMISQLYIFEEEKENRSAFLETLADEYYKFLESTILFYGELEKFIRCIEKKELWVFIHMLD